MKKVSIVLVTMCIVLCLGPLSWAGAKINIGDSGDSWIDLGLLGQFHVSYIDDEDVKDDTDFYLRRGRIIVSGQIADGIKFFVETDNDNAGKSGGSSVSTDIQDAFMDLRLFKTEGSEIWAKAGLILLPFSFENRSSAASLLGIDYNAETIKFAHTFVWRDYGLELHGNITDRFSYALGIFDGYDEPNNKKNPESEFRFTGHLAVNVLGKAETGWFYTQERLKGKGNYLSIGFGIDRQEKASLVDPDDSAETDNSEIIDSEAWVVDLQSGFIFEPVGLTLNVGYYDWDNLSFEGNTMFAEAGVLWKQVMLTGKYSAVEPEEGDETLDYTAGLHYFLKGHRARLGLEYRSGDSPDQILIGLQVLP